MDKIKCLKNMLTAYILYPFIKNKFKNRRIWLVGGNAGELYADNARAIYEYVRSKKEIEEFWVLNENSTIRDKIPGEILIKGSVNAYLHFMNAEVVMFSHSISADIVPFLYVVPLLKKFHYKTLKVFLNHGTVGLKKRKALNAKTEKIVEKMVQSYDLNICDSKFEKDVKSKSWWKVPQKTTFVTGYPRYDKLYNANIRGKEIFFMPTWRPWLKNNVKDIQKTEYFKNIINLLQNETLNKILEIKNIKMTVYIHQLMHEYFDNFNDVKLRKNINILPKDAEITKEIMKSNMLITDYSSIAYDYLYMDMPILFYQFDKDAYEEKIGSYIDLNTELFGEVAYTSEECVEKIVKIINNDWKHLENVLEKVERLKPKFLEYIDKNNSKRVYELIEQKLGEKNARK